MNYKNVFKSRETRIKILNATRLIPDKLMLKIQYRIKLGRRLNLKNPKRYTEKLQWYKLYYRDPVMAKCVDKYTVRNFVKEQGLERILNPLYGVYDAAEDINFDSLPEKFVIKDTLGGGSNRIIICLDKEKLNKDEVLAKVTKWIENGVEKVNPGREWVYCRSRHRIVIEKYIESERKEGLVDWKFFCFNGKVEFIYWLGNRVIGESVECGIFDTDFNLLNVYRTDEKRLTHTVKKPDNFNEMIKIAEKLSQKFPHVRVDLYNENGQIIFGELTFFPGSGYMEFVPDSFDIKIGEKFTLPASKKNINDAKPKYSHEVLGIIGGMGPMATANIFSKIINMTDASKDTEHIHIIIDNYPQIPDRTEAIRNGTKTPVKYIRKSIKRLINAGSKVLILPCCTSHYFYDDITKKCPVKLINMIVATAKTIKKSGINTIGLLATDGTIESNIFEKEFSKFNIKVIKPSIKGQKVIMDIIYNQVKAGNKICPDKIFSELDNMLEKGVEAFILGCTELPIAFSGVKKYKFIDPTDILAIEAIQSVGYSVKENYETMVFNHKTTK